MLKQPSNQLINPLKSEIKTKVFCCQYSEDEQIHDPDIFIILDKEKIPSHKLILITYSEVLAKTLTQNPSLREVTLYPDYQITGYTMRNVLKFLYTSRLTITDPSEMERIKAAGEVLKIPYLTQKCRSLKMEKAEEALLAQTGKTSPTTGASTEGKTAAAVVKDVVALREVQSQTSPSGWVGTEAGKGEKVSGEPWKYQKFCTGAANMGNFDVEITVADTVFPVHSSVVREQCGYVERHLPLAECMKDMSKPFPYTLIPGLRVEPALFADLLLYMYSGQLNLCPGARVEELSRCARILEMRELCKVLGLYSQTYHMHAYADTAPMAASLRGGDSGGKGGNKRTAPLLHLSQLKLGDMSARGGKQDPPEVIPRDVRFEFLKDKDDPSVICQFLGQDYFLDRDEVGLLALAVAWIRHDFARRIFHVDKLVAYIKFDRMTVGELNQCANRYPELIGLSPFLKDRMVQAYRKF